MQRGVYKPKRSFTTRDGTILTTNDRVAVIYVDELHRQCTILLKSGKKIEVCDWLFDDSFSLVTATFDENHFCDEWKPNSLPPKDTPAEVRYLEQEKFMQWNPFKGITVRQWYIGQAIAGLVGNQEFLVRLLNKHEHDDQVDTLAGAAIKIADAAMKLETETNKDNK